METTLTFHDRLEGRFDGHANAIPGVTPAPILPKADATKQALVTLRTKVVALKHDGAFTEAMRLVVSAHLKVDALLDAAWDAGEFDDLRRTPNADALLKAEDWLATQRDRLSDLIIEANPDW